MVENVLAEPAENVAVAKARVFISYSRQDIEFVDNLVESLKDECFQVVIDRTDIAPAEDWKSRLEDLLLQADVVLFVVTEASIASSICAWEIDKARELGKRIVPLSHGRVGRNVPSSLSALNYVFSDDPGMGASAPQRCSLTALRKIIDAIEVDLARLRTHTRMTERAVEWARASNEIKDEFLLPAPALRSAKELLEAEKPIGIEVTSQLRSFVSESIASVEFSRRVALVSGINSGKKTLRLRQRLERFGIPVHEIHTVTEEALRVVRYSPATIVVWNGSSREMAAGPLAHALRQAKQRGSLIPMVVSKDNRAPLSFGEIQTLDFSGWNGSEKSTEFQDLMASLQARLFGTRVAPNFFRQRVLNRLAIGVACVVGVPVIFWLLFQWLRTYLTW